MSYTIVVAATASDPAPMLFIGPVLGVRHRRVLPRQRSSCPGRLRRPVETCAVVSGDLPAPPPPARAARHIPGDVFYLHSRLLERAAKLNADPGRRVADGAADYRDPGGRPVRLHSDQRHLDHRRPDLPRERPVPPGRPPGHQRRQLRVARGRLCADQARCGRWPGRCVSIWRSIASWPRSHSSAATSTRRTQAQLNRGRTARGDPQAAAVRAGRASRSRSMIVYAATKGFIDPVAIEDVRRYEEDLYRFPRGTASGRPRRNPREEDPRR